MNRRSALAGALALTLGAAAFVWISKWRRRRRCGRYFDDGGWMHDGEVLQTIEDQCTLRSTDVITVTVPKCGQTWLMHVLMLMKYSGKLPGDFFDESVWVENLAKFDLGKFNERYTVQERMQQLAALTHPRILKMHTMFDQIPVHAGCSPKVITIVRDLRDQPYSMFRHMCSLVMPHPPWWAVRFFGAPDWSSFPAFFRTHTQNPATFHMTFHAVRTYWDHRNDPNFLILRYEDMKRDTKGEILKIAKFLEWDWVTDDVIDKIVPLAQFDSMKSREKEIFGQEPAKAFSNGSFFHQGLVGENRKHLTAEMEEWLMKKCRELWTPECIDFVFGQTQ